MHVVIVHYSELVPRDDGFFLTRYAATAEHLISTGHRVTRLYPSFSHRGRLQRDHPMRWSDSQYGDFVMIRTTGYRLSRGYSRLRFLSQFKKGVLRELHQLNPEVVLLGLPQPGLAAAVARLDLRQLCVGLDVRDLWPDAQLASSTGLQKLMMLAYAPVIRRRVRKDLAAADFIVAISEQYRKWAMNIDHGSNSLIDRTVVIPLGSPPVPEVGDAGIARRGVVFAGSISAHFDFELLLDAWELLSLRRPDLVETHPLTIIGGGAGARRLYERSHNLMHVDVLGYLSYEDTLRTMVASAVGVAPYSKHAKMGLPNKLFEYLGSGLPVISTLGGEAHDLIVEEVVGLSVPNATSQDLSTSIEQLLDHDVCREQMASRGLALVRTKYERRALGRQLGSFLINRGRL